MFWIQGPEASCFGTFFFSQRTTPKEASMAQLHEILQEVTIMALAVYDKKYLTGVEGIPKVSEFVLHYVERYTWSPPRIS
jgi:hypothetical protein